MKRLLPPKGSPELAAELGWFSTATTSERTNRAAQLGFTGVQSYDRAMRSQGAKIAPSLVPAPPVPQPKPPPDAESLSPEENHIIRILKKSPASIGELSRQLDRSEETVAKLIDSLGAKHYEVVLDETRHEVTIPHEPLKDFTPTEFKYFKRSYRIGVASDTQIGSKYQQMTLLHDAYSIFDSRKTDFNVHPGDVFDGIDMYRGHRDELFLYDADTQLDYAEKNIPKSSRGTKTYIIGGQHDYCFMKRDGYNIISHLCERRDDLVYKGFFNATFNIKGLILEVQHPGGGVSYARSYRIQKIIESMQGHIVASIRANPESIKSLPVLMLFGHWHVSVHLPAYMGLDAASMPCFQSQTKYLQQKGYMPDIGCAIAEVWLDEQDNLSSVKLEFINMNSQIKEKDY